MNINGTQEQDITIFFILRSATLISPFLVQYYDILAFGDIVKVSYQYRYNQKKFCIGGKLFGLRDRHPRPFSDT